MKLLPSTVVLPILIFHLAAVANGYAYSKLESTAEGVKHARTCEVEALTSGLASCHAHTLMQEDGIALSLPISYGPSDLQSAYGINGRRSAASLVVVVDAFGYPNAEADLAVYRAKYGLPPCTSANGCFSKYNEFGSKSGPYPDPNLGWQQEAALDLDMVSAICPNCRIALVEASTSNLLHFAIAVQFAASLRPAAISNSYGAPEAGTAYLENFYNHPGIAVVASTGDFGYGPQFPASSPHVIAVGGTTLTRSSNTKRGWTESVWSGSGAGCSTVYDQPFWQKGITDRACSKRMEADISAVASPSTPVAVYGPNSANSSAWFSMGGTSVGAPLVAGIYGAKGRASTLGSLYTHRSELNTVTTGSDGNCNNSYLCDASDHTRDDYSGPAGLGTPNGDRAF